MSKLIFVLATRAYRVVPWLGSQRCSSKLAGKNMKALCEIGLHQQQGRLCRGLVLGLVLALLVPWVALAQEKSRSVRPPSQRPVRTAPEVDTGDLYAVVVGVSKYRNPSIVKLDLADKDARDFARFLGTQRELFRKIHLVLLVNEQATQQAINRQLLSELRLAGKNDTVVLFFAGHGADDPRRPGDFFFLAHDSDPKAPEATAINMSGSRFMERLDSKRVLLIADACHAGGFARYRTRSTEPSLQRFMRQMKETEGKLVLSASRADELVIEKADMRNGVFTHYLLEGLKGAADFNSDGVVTVQELYEYVYEKTKNNTRGIQHPQLDGRIVGRFPVSMVRLGQSPMPARGSVTPVDSALQPSTALAPLRSRAEKGDAKAQFELGLKYEYGLGLSRDKGEALRWYLKASEKGNVDAKGALARLKPTPPARNIPTNVKSDPSKNGALLKAAEAGNLAEVKRAFSAGADVNAEDEKSGLAVIHIAARSGNKELVQFLLEKGAGAWAWDKDGRSVLDFAAESGNPKLVECFLINGVPIDFCNRRGMTALHTAVQGRNAGCAQVVRFLLEQGANINEKDGYGRTPLEVAEACGAQCREAAQVLRAAIKAKEARWLELLRRQKVILKLPEKLM